MNLICANRHLSSRALLFFALILSLSGVFPSAVTAQITTPLADLPASPIREEDLIHLGDVLDINIVGNFDFDWRGKLNPEGFFNGLDNIDEPIYGLCKSESEVADQITPFYAKILKDPKVNVKIIDRSSRPVAEMLGAVKNQQRFQIRRPVFLNELLILSGGLTDKASGEVQIFRPPNLSCDRQIKPAGDHREAQSGETLIFKIKIADLLKGDKDANPKIFNGDLITILTAEPIYIIGGVQNPKQIALREKMTLSQAINSAGGLSKSGREQMITIFRREGGMTKIIEADLAKVKINQSEDVVLQPYDIVEVGQTGSGKRKYPPVIQEKEAVSKIISSLPLRIIE